MFSLSDLDTQLTSALKNRDAMTADTLRGLKTRIQNERIAKGQDLSEDELIKLVASEVKRRKEAVTMYTEAGRQELADKEHSEIAVLEQFLPAQASEADITAKIDQIIAENSYTAKDFGQAMGALKAAFGNNADGAIIAKLLKEKLK